MGPPSVIVGISELRHFFTCLHLVETPSAYKIANSDSNRYCCSVSIIEAKAQMIGSLLIVLIQVL
jgi:hypothetical protein